MGALPIEEVLGIVRDCPSTIAGWLRLRELCERAQPSPLWGKFDNVNALADVSSARKWLCGQLSDSQSPQPCRGLYLGLDTLNMDDGSRTNIELAVTTNCDPMNLNMDWAWNCEWYGDKHLIDGLRLMKRVYGQPKWEQLYDFADYVLFLGYSGLVLAEALDGVPFEVPCLVVWGFYDGDLFFLGQSQQSGFERISKLG